MKFSSMDLLDKRATAPSLDISAIVGSRAIWEREMQFWDARRWHPRTVSKRMRTWVGATRLRRWTAGITVLLTVLFLVPGIVGAAARAQTGVAAGSGQTTGGTSSVISALSWMAIKDSSGAPLSNYLFVTDHGSLFHPGNTILSVIIGLEFIGWLVIVITAIWLIGFALSFQWLNLVAKALHGVADSLTGQLATPLMLVTAATIGAFFVAYFVVRGFYSKATVQVVTMIVIAMLSPLFLANPLADVLDSDGLLAQGRNVGISVAAGLNGDSSPDPTRLVATIEADMADNFARKPAEVWNFGHTLSSTCQNYYSAGMTSGSESAIKNGMKVCGDTSAYSASSNPTMGQIGSGLVLLISGTIMLLWAAYLAIRIIWSAFDAIYHGFLTIFGFAAGGYVYGPTQIFTIHNIVDGFIAAARMMVQVIALGVYVLFIGDLFTEANGQVMTVFVIGAVVEIIFIFQFGRLTAAVTRGNGWVTGHLTAAISSGRGGSGGGGSGSGSGTPPPSAHTLAANRMLLNLSALNWVATSPVTAWAMGKTRNPLNPYARMEKRAQVKDWTYKNTPWYLQAQSQQYIDRREYMERARAAAKANGGVRSYRGAGYALAALRHRGVNPYTSYGPMEMAGIDDRDMVDNVISAWVQAGLISDSNTFKDKNLGLLVAATQRTINSADALVRGTRGATAGKAAGNIAAMQQAMLEYRDRIRKFGNVTLDEGRANGAERQYVEDYMLAPTEAKIKALQQWSNGNHRIPPLKKDDPRDPDTSAENYELVQALTRLDGMDATQAQRMMNWVATNESQQIEGAVEDLVADPTNPETFRRARQVINAAQNTDQWLTGSARTGANSLNPPGTRPPSDPGHWARALRPVADLLR